MHTSSHPAALSLLEGPTNWLKGHWSNSQPRLRNVPSRFLLTGLSTCWSVNLLRGLMKLQDRLTMRLRASRIGSQPSNILCPLACHRDSALHLSTAALLSYRPRLIRSAAGRGKEAGSDRLLDLNTDRAPKSRLSWGMRDVVDIELGGGADLGHAAGWAARLGAADEGAGAAGYTERAVRSLRPLIVRR